MSPDGAPISGATVAVDGLAPVTTDPGGGYALETTVSSTNRASVSKSGFLLRETLVRLGETREGVNIDLIPTDGSFPLTLFRQMARNASEQPNNLQGIKRWHVPPNIYIETTWRNNGAPVRADGLNYIISEIRRAIPQLTGGWLNAGQIDTGPGRRPLITGWINIHFDPSGNWSYVGQNPGEVQFGLDVPCTSAMVIHELGHAMGYYHSSARPSVMGGGIPANCDPVNFTPDEFHVARVMYLRPTGNIEPDRDPSSFSYFVPGAVEARVVRCDWLLPVRP